MFSMLPNMQLQVNEKVYLKNPESTDLGKRIVVGAIDLLDEIGFEQFNFNKLGLKINSTEASIYRYFENKHKLLLYLISWYWLWQEYRLAFKLANVDSPKDRLLRAIECITEKASKVESTQFINVASLQKLVIAESTKVYHTKGVDSENKQGIFKDYKRIVGKISDIVLEINPEYNYSRMLVSTVIEGANHQRFFAEHLPHLTDFMEEGDPIVSFYKHLVLNAIQSS